MEPNLQETCEADAEEAQKKVVSVETAQSFEDTTSQVNNDGLGPTVSDFHMGIPAENCVHLEKEPMCMSGSKEGVCASLMLISNTNKSTSFISKASTQIAKPVVAIRTSGQGTTGNKCPQKGKSILAPGLKLTTDLFTTDLIASGMPADENCLTVGTTLLQQSANIKREKSKSADCCLQPAGGHSVVGKSALICAAISSKDTSLPARNLAVSQKGTCEIEGQLRKEEKNQLIDHLKHSAADENTATLNESGIESCLAADTLPTQQNTGKKRGRCKKEKNELIGNPAMDLHNRSVNGGCSETRTDPVNIPKKRGRKPKSAMVAPQKEILSHGNIENGGDDEVETAESLKVPKKRARKPKNAKAVSVKGKVPQALLKRGCDNAENGDNSELGAPQLVKTPKKRGRKPKNAEAMPVEGVMQQIPSEGICESVENDGDGEMGAPQPAKALTKRGRKPKNAKTVLQTPLAGGNRSENGGDPQPVKTPKKRGRKPKNEMVPQEETTDTHGLLKPIVQRLLEESGADDELTASGRPKRRAARAALLYLHEIVEEIKSPSYKVDDVVDITNDSEPDQPRDQSLSEQYSPKRGRGRKKKKVNDVFDDLSDDKDFVVSDGVTDEEEEEEGSEVEAPSDVSESDLDDFHDGEGQKQRRSSINKQCCSTKRRLFGNFANGLPNTIMVPVWEATTITRKHREEHHSPWVFPHWMPSMQDWSFLSQSESLKYLPNEVNSPIFKIKREGLREEPIIQRLKRFQSLPAHKDRWDVNFFVGGPVWCLEWCPTPEGSAACQYAAIYCNKGMDDRHKLMDQHAEPTLLQIWQLGDLQQEQCPEMNAALAYGVATEHGCIWDMKWCPSGAWELPETPRKSPQMARLGILAAAFSTGKIVVYSLPHPESLNIYKMQYSKASSIQGPIICKVQCTVILEIGSVQFSGSSQCGQCFCLDWMPSGEHEYLAAGFYDGTVALWNLNTSSLLLRVQQGDGTLKVYPFHSFVAHDHAVKAIVWSKAHSNFLVTASPDRKIKFWDLRRTYQPINEIKRYLNTEVAWLLPWCGVMVAQENCYAAFGLSGIHYVDAGFLGFKPYFAAPRAGTVWSISGSDWLNTCVSGDNTGEVIAVILPDCMNNTMNIKRPNERRFPIYKADLVHHNATNSISAATSNLEEKEASVQMSSSEMGKEDLNSSPVTEPKIYSDTVKKYYLMFDDTDLKSFKNLFSREPFKRMQTVDKAKTYPDRMPLESVYKVRFNPNLDAHGWILSAGQSGIVRAHCVRSLNTHVSRKLIKEYQAQFSSMFQPTEAEGVENPITPTVTHSVKTALQTE
ncbi:general transcription factor 3C polypeptide 2 isoform X1 [Carcharodon carcharias]|uniref:general transcription factor 3C polypeptide 2 isoform X1 n=1 Tax=Carcharodon carcharias TaxID=13397 RepID=UPI001B7E6C15|nr:general transcription factor 3C polypeptide 2 isoform X1 [Carcharodon carcharias]